MITKIYLLQQIPELEKVYGEMVLYKRKPIVLPPPKTLPDNLNVKVWHINETGEWFTTYEEYLARLDFYTRHYFTCEITGTSCLTFFEALNSEEMQFKHVEEKFPLKLREPVARFLHFNEVRRVDLLVEQVYARFKNDFFPGETVFLRKHTSKNSSPTPGSEDGELQQNQQQIQLQYQKPYVIKEKAQFNAIVDPITNEERTPAYSKYMIFEEGGARSLIADQNQIYRDRSTFTKHLIKCFCKITLRRASNKMGAPWCVKEEYLPMYGLTLEWPSEMLRYKDDYFDSTVQASPAPLVDEVSDKRKLDQESFEIPDSKKIKSSEEPIPTSDSQPQSQQVTSIVDDLKLPFNGSPPKLNSIYYYNKYLDRVHMDTKVENFQDMGRLLQAYQFCNTFNEALNLSNFSLDDFIASIKCTSPSELTGMRVEIDVQEALESNDIDTPNNEQDSEIFSVTNQSSEYVKKLEYSDPEFCQLIKNLNSKTLHYKVVKQELATDEQLDATLSGGAALFVECFVALLRLFIDESGDWKCIIVDNWFSDESGQQVRNNDISEENEENVEEGLQEGTDADSDTEFDSLLNKCLQFRNVDWSERLMNRQFQNGYWLIILLGIYQDCIHLKFYAEFIQEFVKLVIPPEGTGTQLNKILWRNFCRNLTFQQKVHALWLLVDLVSNFSQDIKSTMEDSMEVCGQIRSERFKIARDLKSSMTVFQTLEAELKIAKEENKDEAVTKKLEENVATQQTMVERLQDNRNYLDKALFENDLQRLRCLGLDRYGNRYYWLELSGLERSYKPDGSTKSGRLWIQGPPESDAQFYLQISEDEIHRWRRIYANKSSEEATKEVFGIYKTSNGSFKHRDDVGETTLVDENGSVNSLIALSPIQRKIIEEGPERLLLSDLQWISIESVDDVEKLMSWFDTWGRREHDLSKQFKSVQEALKSSLRLRESRLHKFDDKENVQALLKELADNEVKGEDLLSEKNMKKDELKLKIEIELEIIAEKIMKLDDSSKTRHVLNQIEQLEARRDELMTLKIQSGNNNNVGARIQLRAERQINKLGTKKKIENQEEILTELLNLKNYEAYELCSSWRNTTALKLWGTSLYKGAKGKPKAELQKSLDKKMEDILKYTSRISPDVVIT